MASVFEPRQAVLAEYGMAGWKKSGARMVMCGAMWVLLPSVVVAEPGDHIRPSNNLVISPGVGLSVDYHSNIFLSDGVTTNSQGIQSVEVPGVSVTPSPHLDLGLQNSDVELAVSGEYMPRIYPSGLFSASTFSDNKLNIGLDVLPASILGFGINENWNISSRLVELESESALDGSVSDPEMRKLSNDLSAGLAFHPGSALKVNLDGVFDWERWEMPKELNSTGEYYYNSKVVYGADLDSSWRFFPSTQVIFNGSLEFNDWDRNLSSIEGELVDGELICDSDYGCYLPKPDATIWRLMTGLEGQITDKVSVNLLAGYGQAQNSGDSVEEYASTIGATVDSLSGYDDDLSGIAGILTIVNLRYEPIDGHQITLGFNKNFRDTYYTNNIYYWSLLAQYRMSLVDKVDVVATGAYRRDSHLGYVGSGVGGSREDNVIRLKGQLDYKATKWMDIGGSVGWDERGSATGNVADEYDDVWVTLSADFTY